jgi:hypothetical protein
MKVGIEQLKKIKPGTKMIFPADNPRELNNIRVICSYTHLCHPEFGLKFKTSIDRKNMTVTVEAIKD